MVLRDSTLATQLPTPTIADEINAATRVLHTELNKLIIARLPLAIPPYQTTSAPYTIGLEAFAGIYFAFEGAWDQCLARRHQSDEEHELISVLNCLLPSNLRRTQHLRNDLRHLHSHIVLPNVAGDTQSQILLPTVSPAINKPGSILHSFTSHINQVILEKPHLIIAYTWVMYMALFSGGRWIRAQLRTADDGFWTRCAADADDLGYSFLTFEGQHDGEDIKSEFKRQLASAEYLLTPAQRMDVVVEAKEVFRRTAALIGQLDELAHDVVATTAEKRSLDGSATSDSRLHATISEKYDALPVDPSQRRRIPYRKAPILLLPAILCIVVLFMTTPTVFLKSQSHYVTT